MVKYAFGFPVVAMVSYIRAKSRMAVNYVRSCATHLWRGVETADLDFHNVQLKSILLICTLGLVRVNEQVLSVLLIHFALERVPRNFFIIHHSIMDKLAIHTRALGQSVSFQQFLILSHR